MRACHPRAGDPAADVISLGRLLVLTVDGKIAGVGVLGEDGEVMVSTAAADAAYFEKRRLDREAYKQRRLDRVQRVRRPVYNTRDATTGRLISRAAARKLQEDTCAEPPQPSPPPA